LKVKKSQEFLEDGHDVKITVRLRWREHIYAERVYEKLLAIMDYLSEWSRPQYPRPKKEAHGYSIILMPKS
jgi:translation initiation factor IF-3